MIVALMIGRAGSRGFPGKNTKKILGKHLCEFPLLACKNQSLLKRFMYLLMTQKLKKLQKI